MVAVLQLLQHPSSEREASTVTCRIPGDVGFHGLHARRDEDDHVYSNAQAARYETASF